MYDITDLQDFLEQFEDMVTVIILEDNKYVVTDTVMLQSNLVYEIDTKNVSITGIGSNEFHIQHNGNENEYTIQVSPFELENSITAF